MMATARRKKCRDCGQIIFMVRVSTGKEWPLNEDQTAHFITCPKAQPRPQKNEQGDV